MSEEVLSGQRLLQLRREAVEVAEQAFRKAKGAEARHYARLQLQKNRRALEALSAAH
jgi:hypothetical protein